MVMSAESISAEMALEYGFVNEVVPRTELAAAVRRWCDKILKCAPLAIRASKETMLRGLDEPTLASALANQKDYPGFSRWRHAEDTKEGPRAFAEKRPPRWQGR